MAVRGAGSISIWGGSWEHLDLDRHGVSPWSGAATRRLKIPEIPEIPEIPDSGPDASPVVFSRVMPP